MTHQLHKRFLNAPYIMPSGCYIWTDEVQPASNVMLSCIRGLWSNQSNCYQSKCPVSPKAQADLYPENPLPAPHLLHPPLTTAGVRGRGRTTRRRQRNKRLSMRRLRRAIRAIVIRHNLTPIRDNLVIQNALKMLQTSLGLVIWHLVPRLIYSRETEVSILPHLAVLDAVDEEGSVASGIEGGFVGVVDGEGHGFAAEPVANIVCVTVEEGNANAVAEDLRELVDERVDKVAGGLEAGTDRA